MALSSRKSIYLDGKKMLCKLWNWKPQNLEYVYLSEVDIFIDRLSCVPHAKGYSQKWSTYKLNLHFDIKEMFSEK